MLISIFLCKGQEDTSVFYQLKILSDKAYPPHWHYQSMHSTLKMIDEELRMFEKKAREQGYYEAAVDSVLRGDTFIIARFHLGEKYDWGSIQPGNIPNGVLSGLGIRMSDYEKEKLKQERIPVLMDLILDYYENHGYPFASVSIRNITIQDKKANGQLHIEKGPFIVFDSIFVKGDARVSASFLSNFLGIRPGMPYSEKLYRAIDQKIKSLPFVSVWRQSVVFFVGDKARPAVHLNKRPSDQVNGIIGFAPNTAVGSTNKLLLTGEFQIKLQNLFQSSKSFDLYWRSFRERSQELKAGVQLPYILHSPLGVELRANFLKFDTLYTELEPFVGFQYLFDATNKLKLYYRNKSTNLISVDTNSIKSLKTLPATNAMSNNYYGIVLLFNKLDYIFNPRKGWVADLDLAVGQRIIRKDIRISGLRIPVVGNPAETYSLYDSIQLKTSQLKIAYTASYFLPLKKSSTFMLQVSGEHLVSERIYFNELLRFGGIKSLRGFNEQSFFASSYSILNIEYRYLFGQNSYFQLFWNGAYYEDASVSRNTLFTDMPWGVGSGVNLETASGIFSIYYALGSQNGQPIAVKNGKIHFGITSYF